MTPKKGVRELLRVQLHHVEEEESVLGDIIVRVCQRPAGLSQEVGLEPLCHLRRT